MKHNTKPSLARAAMTLLFALLCATGLQAKTYTKFTCTDGTAGANSSQGPDKFVDGIIDKMYKWCVTTLGNPTYIEFNSAVAFVPTGYILTTCYDSARFPGRNPKSWRLLGKVNQGDANWTEIVSVTDNTTMTDTNITPFEFAISGVTTAYQYFRFEVSAVQDGTVFQLNEIELIGFEGDPKDLGNASIEGLSNFYIWTGSVITPTFTVKEAYGNELTENTDYTVSYSPAPVQDEGNYTLTISAKEGNTAGYLGSQTLNFAVTSTPTVYNNTNTDTNIPIACNYTTNDKTRQSEFMMPSSDLCAMRGSEITAMKFYTQTDVSSFTTGMTYKVYMKEVESLPTTDFIGPNNATVVYDGALTITSNMMTITFTNSFFYYGGSLLIGFKTTDYTKEQEIAFYGQAFSLSTGCYGDSSGHIYSCNFLPKTTFTCDAHDETKDLTLATVTGLPEKFWWTGGEEIPITYTLTNSENETIPTSGYTAVIKNSSDETVETVTARGDYTLTLTGVDPYFNSKTVNFSVVYYSINLPVTGSEQVEIPSDITALHIYDNGGESGPYSTNCRGKTTLTAPEGKVLVVEGEMHTTSRGDYLTIYNGTSTDEANKLGIYFSENHVGPLLSTGRSMTFDFYSGSVNYAQGFDLAVWVVDPNQTFAINGLGSQTGGSVTASVGGETVTNCQYGASVTLDLTPASGYLLTGLTVSDGENNLPVSGGTWYNTTATFIMPRKAVTVSATFTEMATAQAEGLFINMDHCNNAMTVTIPSGVTSFSIYDDGGKDGNYISYDENSDYFNTILTVTTPDNTAMRVSGTLHMGTNASSTVGDDQGNSIIYVHGDGTAKPVSGETANNVLKVRATSYTDDIAQAGIDLNVTVVSAYRQLTGSSDYDGLTFAFSGEGVIQEDGTYKAKAGGTVTVTMSADSDFRIYRLKAEKQVGENTWNDIGISWNGFLFKTATFTMPINAVRVTAQIRSDNVEVDPGLMIPMKGTAEMTIPSDINSFHVYDFAGKDGDVSIPSYEGNLILTAPEGKTFQMSNASYTNMYPGKYIIIYNTDNDVDITGFNANNFDNDKSTKEYAAGDMELCKRIRIYHYCYWGNEIDSYEGVNLLLNVIDIPDLTLNDASANNLTDNKNKTRNVTISGRNLVKDDNWNTLCLPFPLSAAQIAASELAGATIKELDTTGKYTDAGVLDNENGTLQTGFNASSGTLSLYFKDAETIEAGKPYLIKWANDGSTISDPVFPEVTISSTTPTTVEATNSGLNTVQFIGTYNPTPLAKDDQSNLFLGEGSQLFWPNVEDYSINAFRAYFHVDLTGSTNVRSFVLNFGEDGEAQGIESLTSGSSTRGEGSIYTLDGVKLDKMPTRKGLYIHNGKKVVIK